MFRPHVIALKASGLTAAALGLLWLLCRSSPSSLLGRIAIYTLANCVFHYLEFMVTALYNARAVDDDSFLLSDQDLHLAFAGSVLETTVVLQAVAFRPASLVLGLVVLAVGQAVRGLAMYTAGLSFHHLVQRQKAADHVLVTGGVYGFLRHPSYFGYFWWFVGCQVVLQNWGMGVYGAMRLVRFFRNRIAYEEQFLLGFFPEYKAYRARTYVGIPWAQVSKP